MNNNKILFAILAVTLVLGMASCDLLGGLGGGGGGDGSTPTAPTPPTTVTVTGVSLKSATSLVVGGTETLSAVIDPPTATNKNVTWTSSNASVATVSASGAVTAVAAGTAVITVKTANGNKTAECVVTVVTSAVPVTGVTLNKSSTSLGAGSAEYLVPIITPSNATNQNVTWSSSNASTATVSAGGLVTAVAAGTATITVTTVDGNKTAACNVTVTAPATPSTPTFTSVADFETWLKTQPENTANTAYNVVLKLNSLNGLKEVLLNASHKYVSINLSGNALTSIPDYAFFDRSGNKDCTTLVAITIPDKRKMTHFTQLQG